jgi:hypothetical protein
LHYAAESGNVEVIEALLAAGARVDSAQRYQDHTPLHVALTNRREEAAIVLLKRGANPSAETATHQTGYTLAALVGKRFELRFRENVKPTTSHPVPAPAPAATTMVAAPASASTAPATPATTTVVAAAEPAAPPLPVAKPLPPGLTILDMVRAQQKVQAGSQQADGQ